MYNDVENLSEKSVQHWLAAELFTWQWFVMAGVLAVAYTVWLILLDRKRAVGLLLLGSLTSVFFSIANTLITFVFNFIEYKIRFLPVYPPILVAGVTLSPIVLMLVQQYTSGWPKFLLWAGLGIAFVSLAVFPFYAWIGIGELHKGWNWLYQFLLMFALAIFTRVIYLWISGVEGRAVKAGQ